MIFQDAPARRIDCVEVVDARARASRRNLRYRLAVLAVSTEEAVRAAGGLICDRALNGWDVTVVAATLGDLRALQVVGADVVELDAALAGPNSGPAPHALAISAQLCRADERVRAGLLDTIRTGRTEVTVWGEMSPSELGGQLTVVQHQLTIAATAFKSQALGALAADDSIGRTEVFGMGPVLGRRPWPQDLAPAS
ncbi:hypothetical protein [Mycolicibacterium sp. HK-90]|uniref:hypothetical protein n=1 Tax=Mycolicibacterium sp. HK-90 TaxID=3056937 RepID=UPI002659CE63|nr:hypothetical protein [Mycolicibacterium sp. HK-90]WKG04048.1 hypothetical protein QU592_02680 [Mycolicibacterium sp. HK-90]